LEEGVVVQSDESDRRRNGHGKANLLTSRERDVVLAIVNYQIKHGGRSPSMRELCEALGVSSTATVFKHLCNLQEKGYVTSEPFTARSVRLV
jgi:repressor LexA